MIAWLAWLALVVASPAGAVPATPTSWVTDRAGVLDAQVEAQLDARLAHHAQTTGQQVVVWIGESTGGVPLEEWAARTFAAWRVGRKGLDDGVALFVLTGDRRLRIEVGYGLEGRLPDVTAARILDERMVPKLRAGDVQAAVQVGVDGILAALGESPAGGQAPIWPYPWWSTVGMALLALAFLLLAITNPRAALWMLYVITSGRRGGGGGGGGFSGGGGRSGGGGASGHW